MPVSAVKLWPPVTGRRDTTCKQVYRANLLSFLISTDTNLSLQLGSGGSGERRSGPPPHCYGRGCLVRSNNHEVSRLNLSAVAAP